jgi:Cdc6-like AAA superfamily ATPase
MSDTAVANATSFQRFVLLAIADLSARSDAPVHSYDVRRVCETRADSLDADLFGGVTRREVITALSALEDAGLLEEATVTSPVGKGRPAYELAVDPVDVLDAVADDDRLGALVARIGER